MGVYGMLTAGDGLLANRCPHRRYAFWMLYYPLDLNFF